MAKLKEALYKKIKNSPPCTQIPVPEYSDLHPRVNDLSFLDPLEGIRFRGKTIPEILAALPKHRGGKYPSIESFYWFLLTGQAPTEQEANDVVEDFKRRRALPTYVVIVLRALPREMHPMSMFSAAIFSMQQESLFVRRYNNGLDKDEYWDPMYEDCTNLLAKLPAIAAYIYRMKYKGDLHIPPNQEADFGGDFASLMGIPEPYDDAARLHFILHSNDQSLGASGDSSRFVASALSDAYYALCAHVNRLAGPLHGLASQEVLRWIMDLSTKMGGKLPTQEEMQRYVLDTLESGQSIPGYGHTVLQKTDPRYLAQREFCLRNFPDDPLFRYVDLLYRVVPSVLQNQANAGNPWPSVDAQSGVVQWHYGLKEWDFYPVLFGIGQAVGVLSKIVWDCARGLRVDRPEPISAGMLEHLTVSRLKTEEMPAI